MFSRYSNFCLDILVMYNKPLIRKIRLILKFMTLQPRKQTIAIHTLPNISRSKENEAVEFGRLIEYNIGNILLEKLYTKCCGETILRPFFKKSKFSISLHFHTVCFYCMLSLGLLKYVETRLQTTCIYII